MVRFAGNAIQEIESDAATVWAETTTLRWLKGWDRVLVTEAPVPGGTFLLVEDRFGVSCQWTKVEPCQELQWCGDDGSEGRVSLENRGNVTVVTYASISVPRAAVDKIFGGLAKTFAKGMAQSESNKDAADELRSLARRVARRRSGSPFDDSAPRFMLEMCEFGAGAVDADITPMFDADGRLRLESDETVLWCGQATPSAEAAQAAGGKEQFETLWRSPEPADVTLTDRRLVYDLRRFVRGDASWLILGGLLGPTLAAASALRARSQRAGRTLAGQIRHLQLANLITGAESRPTFSTASTVTATMVELPQRLLRVSLDLRGDPAGALGLTRVWAQAAAADRMARFPDLAQSHLDEWTTLMQQRDEPTPKENFHGDFWALPLACALNRTRPLKT
jgi:hypothetical protein